MPVMVTLKGTSGSKVVRILLKRAWMAGCRKSGANFTGVISTPSIVSVFTGFSPLADAAFVGAA